MWIRDVGTFPRCWILEIHNEKEEKWDIVDQRDTDDLDGCRQLPVHFQIAKVNPNSARCTCRTQRVRKSWLTVYYESVRPPSGQRQNYDEAPFAQKIRPKK